MNGRKILIFLVVVFIAIQFFRPKPNVSSQTSPNDIIHLSNASPAVSSILHKACYDCHSNNTRYPWYSKIQPVAWWLNNHIQEGKRHINYSEFGTFALRRQYKKLEETAEMVDKGEMPLSSYTLIHTDAKLTDTEKQMLITWANAIRDTMKAKYPADSLLKKK
jgi:hypothetical protein